MKKSASIAILIALTLCSFVPFASRAVYLDEPIYLHFAKSLAENHWVYPKDPDWIFFGIHMKNTAMRTHSPMGEYCLAALFKLFGGFQNAPFRLAWGIFSIIAVLSFYRLARHFTSNSLLVAALFAVSPAFFIMSPTLMMDIPILAFLLAGLSFYLDNVQGKRIRLCLVPICFALSLGMGYTAFIPIGCLFLWAAFCKRPLAELFAIAAGPVCLLLQQYVMMRHFGVLPVAELIRQFSAHSAFLSNALPTFSFLGGIGLFPWALPALTDFSKKWLLTGIAVVSAVILSLFCDDWPSLLYRAWYVALASCGIAWLFVFVLKSRRRDSNRPLMHGFLVMWAPAGLLFFLLMGEFVSARYFLLSLPPLFLISLAQVRRTGAAVALAATFILSVSLAVADYRYVNYYRSWVDRNVVPLQQQGFRIWNAAESGLRFYLNQRGIVSLEKDTALPRGGDLIVKQSSFDLGLPPLDELLLTLREDDIQDSYFLRVFVKDSAAGFYDSHFGFAPYSFSRSPLDRLKIMEVSPFVTQLPRIVPNDLSSVPVWFDDEGQNGVQLKQVQPIMLFPMTIPQGATFDYRLDGEGSLELSENGIALKKSNAGPEIYWKNFRLIPAGFPHFYESNPTPYRH
jgi:hypothetical protein